MTGSVLGVLAGVLELGIGARWFHLVRRVQIPADRRGYHAAHAAAVVLGVGALALGASAVPAALAVVAMLGGATMLGLAAQAGQRRTPAAVAVGGRILDFVLPDETGAPFDLASLRGRPFLLKFFRGHW